LSAFPFAGGGYAFAAPFLSAGAAANVPP